ncbi:hypothetical protein CC117_04775 [Parafrankia colletiae]|uniref:Major facilitator superfamily (MFS) profile domain-containing protein n=1 Tax=Parafrankia colletiae TaxID=573497 RepID=A0A1S1QFW5_9ACTN|nr:MFS transporter [Parafrankia colletiae]MCK9900397.1 MFS transporter [Frankia sp. Cpl3]OHV33698.1 hypothetical protein CC117_04775 [Parafrankia colletiae]
MTASPAPDGVAASRFRTWRGPLAGSYPAAVAMVLCALTPFLVLGWPVARMRVTAMVMNMGIFGAVAIGPVIGGAFDDLGDWRLLFWLSAVVGAVALLLAVLMFTDLPPQDRALKFDAESLALAFFGASRLADHSVTAPTVLVPMFLGVLRLVGLIVGASVAPGLFVAGFALPSTQLPRIFALVELLRGVAAFLTAPLIVHLARTTGDDLTAGIRNAALACFVLVVVGVLLVVGIAVSGGLRLQAPRIVAWQNGPDVAIDSPPLGAALRQRFRQQPRRQGRGREMDGQTGGETHPPRQYRPEQDDLPDRGHLRR